MNTSRSQSVADLDTIMPCNHQEADSRTFLHLSHATQQGHSFHPHSRQRCCRQCCWPLWHLGLMYLWISYGTGKAFQNTAVHEITQNVVLRSHCRFHCSILSAGVIRRYRPLASGRKLSGQHDRRTQTLLKHELLFPTILDT